MTCLLGRLTDWQVMLQVFPSPTIVYVRNLNTGTAISG
jgi:hypothetical protein